VASRVPVCPDGGGEVAEESERQEKKVQGREEGMKASKLPST